MGRQTKRLVNDEPHAGTRFLIFRMDQKWKEVIDMYPAWMSL
jgi:hypothetical protein